VTRDPAGGYKIVFGERRWRAHQRNGAATILARVVDMAPDDVLVAQVIENTQRADMTPLEEAHAYQGAIDLLGAEEAARRLGFVALSAITNRTSLLRLLPEYQHLLSRKQLKTSQAFEMSQLSPVGQKKLFGEIRLGRCTTLPALRAVATAIREREQQSSIFDLVDAPPEPTAEDRKAVSRLARKIRQVEAILAMGFDDNEIVAQKKIDPDKAANYADKLVLIQKHLGQMERALRGAAVGDLFAVTPERPRRRA
jgi:ParB family chromosome partitioning protein